MAEVHYCLDLVNGNVRTILHLDNSYSTSACVGKSITGMIPLPVTLFLLSQQILCGSTWINFTVPKDTYFMTCDHTENLLLGKKLLFWKPGQQVGEANTLVSISIRNATPTHYTSIFGYLNTPITHPFCLLTVRGTVLLAMCNSTGQLTYSGEGWCPSHRRWCRCLLCEVKLLQLGCLWCNYANFCLGFS